MFGMSFRPIIRFNSLLVRMTSIVLLVPFALPVSAMDITAGQSVFNQCAGCHAVGPDAAHRFGPQLNGVMSRGAGIAADYDYSAAMNKLVDGRGNLITSVEKIKKMGAKAKKALPEAIIKRAQEDDI